MLQTLQVSKNSMKPVSFFTLEVKRGSKMLDTLTKDHRMVEFRFIPWIYTQVKILCFDHLEKDKNLKGSNKPTVKYCSRGNRIYVKCLNTEHILTVQ